MYSVLLSIVQSATPLALYFASPSKGHGEMSLTEDGVEFEQLDEGPVRDKRGGLGMLGSWSWAWGCWVAVEPGLRQRRSTAVREESRAERSRAERSSPLAGAMERPWAGAEAGAGGRVVCGLRRWSWKPRQRRLWCWDLALCCCRLWTGGGDDHLESSNY